MRQLLVFIIFIISFTSIAQNSTLKKISFTEFFNIIEESSDSIVKISKTQVILDNLNDLRYSMDYKVTENDTIVVSKDLELNEVYFDPASSFKHFVFKKSIKFINCNVANFKQSTFKNSFEFIGEYGSVSDGFKSGNNYFTETYLLKEISVSVQNNWFYNVVRIDPLQSSETSIIVKSNKFYLNDFKKEESFFLQPLYFNNANVFSDNLIINDGHEVRFNSLGSKLYFTNNNFKGYGMLDISVSDYYIENNKLPFFSNIQFNKEKSYIDLNDLIGTLNFADDKIQLEFYKSDSVHAKKFAQNHIISNRKVYNRFIANQNNLYENFKSNRNQESSNTVYIKIKDTETKRLKYLYNKKKNLTNFFNWQINSIIGKLSSYGTQPYKAIVWSIYVILFFALFYFLFPNDWDSSGKNRLIKRYNFFLKYLNIDSGMHDLYLDETNKKMMEYDEFKKLIDASEHSTPKFFKHTALPLYKWSVLGSKFTSKILKRFDILHGTWNEVPKRQKWWKGSIITLFFVLAVVYDVLIKFLNALMLSINTFSTLGFGEIPIKGLPRYLAIIQGFIGWFMLTIFSVSLISQLLS